MELFALEDQRDVILTKDAVLDSGKELSGVEIGELIAQFDRARLETLWREMHRNFPLGTWVTNARSKRTSPDQVTGYKRARPGEPGHMLEVRTAQGGKLRVPVSEARLATPPQGYV